MKLLILHKHAIETLHCTSYFFKCEMQLTFGHFFTQCLCNMKNRFFFQHLFFVALHNSS